MVGKMLSVVTLVFLGLYGSFCSAQVPLQQMVSFQSASMSDQNQLTQSGVTQQEGNQLQESLPETKQSWQQIQRRSSEASQVCEVEESSRVGCGEPGISPAECEALDCCYDNRQFIQAYDGPMCYFGKAVTVQCTVDGQFILVISRDVTIPSINLDSISILEATGDPCTAVDSNDDFAIYQFPVTACGARAKVDGDYIVYENTMASLYEVGFGPHGAITRDSSFELTFECRFLASAVEDLVVDVNTVPPHPAVVQKGALRVQLRLANGVCTTKGCFEADAYSSYYTEADYPVTKVLQDPVYVEVRIMERADPNIALVLKHCWATRSPDSSSLPQWDLVVDGCPYEDDRYWTTLVPVAPSSGLQYPTHYKRFVVKMFSFVYKDLLIPLKEELFIHCSTAVCQLSATESCEPSCHRTRRSVSTAQDSGKKVLVSSGMVCFIDDSAVSAKSQTDGQEKGSQVVGYGLYGGGALLVLSVCLLLVAALSRRKKSCLQITRL